MPKKSEHYERAFENYLRTHQLPYIVVNQLRRPLVADTLIKNFDFIVRAVSGQLYMVDVKGRQFPQKRGSQRALWENWITTSDIQGLALWQGYFGYGFTGLIVAAYWVKEDKYLCYFRDLHKHRGRTYGLVAVTFDDYRAHCRLRSPRWGAFYVPGKKFSQLVCPLSRFLLGAE